MGNVLNLLGNPLLAQAIGDFGNAVPAADLAGLIGVVGNDHQQLFAAGGCLDHLVQMATVRRKKSAEVNARPVHGSSSLGGL